HFALHSGHKSLLDLGQPPLLTRPQSKNSKFYTHIFNKILHDLRVRGMLICPNTLKLEAGQIISIFCIMDDLIEIVHQLSTVEIAQLKKELKADKQKLKLLEYLLVTDEIQNEEIIEVLNYQNNKSAYYTFK